MFCPRCGTENEEGDRFCVSCGASLQKTPEPSERKPLRERIRELIGTTPRARAITVGTAVAIAIAIAAFIAIPAAKDSSDSYTRAADDLCVQSKAQIGTVEQHIPPTAGPGTFADALVPIIAGWRFQLNALPTPNDHADEAAQLDLALRQVEIDAGTLARASQSGGGDLLALARQGDDASAKVEDAVKDLNLSRCGHLAVGLVPVPPSRR
jgi:zinc-ribbon domain